MDFSYIILHALVIYTMVRVDMRYTIGKRGGVYVFTKCFYINVLEEDAKKIQCGNFLCVYGMIILNSFNKGKTKIHEWNQDKQKFPLKLTFKNNKEKVCTVLDNKNIEKYLHLDPGDDTDFFFIIEKIPAEDRGQFSNNANLEINERKTNLCDLTTGLKFKSEVMNVEINFLENDQSVIFLIPEKLVRHISYGIFLSMYGKIILDQFRGNYKDIPDYDPESCHFPMKLKIWDPLEQYDEFDSEHRDETLYWDDLFYNHLFLEKIPLEKKSSFLNNVTESESKKPVCPICLNNLHGPIFAYDDGESKYNDIHTSALPGMDTEITKLDCKHTFHTRCVLNLCMRNYNLCPLCRVDTGEEWRNNFFKSKEGNAVYCKYYYEKSLEDTESELIIKINKYKDKDKDKDELMYLEKSITKLRNEKDRFISMKEAVNLELDFLKQKKQEITPERSTGIISMARMRKISTIMDRIILLSM
jgi:hypothetical protein